MTVAETPTRSPLPADALAERERTALRGHWYEGAGLRELFTSVDHKRIGIRYLVTAFLFFLAGGVQALLVRTQLAEPANDLVGPALYNQMFSMHGITMIFLFITPMLSGFGNYLVPLQIGARDMAFPRLNAFSYWVYLASGLFMYSSLLIGQAPDNGWFNYSPLTATEYSPDIGIDYYTLGLVFLSIATTAGAANFIVTIAKLRAPGMTIARMPLFCWAILSMAVAVIFALPSLTAANVLLSLQRTFGFHFFAPEAGGDPVLWQHLFWIFGHPDVYIIFLPAVGIVSSVVATAARRPVVAYPWLAAATAVTGFIGFGVWVHHMFAVGLPSVSLGFFAAASMIIAVPSGVQVFAWLATLLGGKTVVRTPLLFILGFLVLFVIGGVTGVMFAAVPFDQQVTDSYFVVAHFHYVLFGGAVFPIFAGLYHWVPKMSGRMLSERVGRWSFWLMFVGFNATFFPMHILGLLGMPRRIQTYDGDLGWDALNLLCTVGAFVLATGVLLTGANLLVSLKVGRPAGPDPWGGDTLEWTVPSPPPEWNFAVVPTVRDVAPAWDAAARAEDVRRAAAAEDVLPDGHLTAGTSTIDADPERVLHMSGSSPWPFVAAVALAVLFTGLLLEAWWLAAAGGVGFLAAVGAWHHGASVPHTELVVEEAR